MGRSSAWYRCVIITSPRRTNIISNFQFVVHVFNLFVTVFIHVQDRLLFENCVWENLLLVTLLCQECIGSTCGCETLKAVCIRSPFTAAQRWSDRMDTISFYVRTGPRILIESRMHWATLVGVRHSKPHAYDLPLRSHNVGQFVWIRSPSMSAQRWCQHSTCIRPIVFSGMYWATIVGVRHSRPHGYHLPLRSPGFHS